MTETHIDPDQAWSDSQQQITPAVYQKMIGELVLKRETSDDIEFLRHLESIRHQIDDLDLEVLNLLSKRMKLSEEIGRHKKHNRVSILQLAHWNEILENAKEMGRKLGLSEGFVSNYLSAVHQESIAKQATVKDTDID
jgi:chorismate mutase